MDGFLFNHPEGAKLRDWIRLAKDHY